MKLKMNVRCLLTAIPLVLVAISCCTRQAPAPDKVTFGVDVATIASAPVFVAEAQGFWKQDGLDVEIKPFVSGRLALDALVANAVNSATVADIPVVLAAFQTQSLRIIVTFSNSEKHVNMLARRDRGISKPQDLRGKRIAVSPGTATEFVMDMFLEKYGVARSEIKIIALQPPDTVAAITRGDVDVIFAWQPHIQNAQKQLGDNAIVFSSEGIYNQPFNVVTTQDYLDRGRGQLLKLVSGLKKAEKFMKENRKEAIEIVARKLAVGADDLSAIWDGYSFEVGLDPNLASLMEKEGKWTKRAGINPPNAREPDYGLMVDEGFLKNIK